MAKGRDIDMLSGSLGKGLTLFAIPVALTAMLEQLINSVDVFILGHYIGTAEMAAVGNDVPILALIINLFIGLSLGANVVIAYHIGAKNTKAAIRTVHTSFLFAVLVGALLTVIGELFTVELLNLLKVPPDVLPDAELYLRIYLLALPFLSLYNFGSAILRSRGDTRTPLYALIAASITNIVGDLIAVTVLGAGLAGVAWATALSYIVMSTMLVRSLLRASGIVHLEFGLLRLHASELRALLRIGIPAAIQGMVFCLANLVIQSAINSLGSDVMAASAAAFTIEINIYCIIVGFQQATTTFVSINFGARKMMRCRRVVRTALLLTVGSMVALGIIVMLLEHRLLLFFTDDPTVIRYGIIRLEYVVVPEVLCVFFDIFSGAMRGYGDSLRPAVLTLISVCGTRLSWVFFCFPYSPTFKTLMIIYPISWIAASLLLYLLYRFTLRHMHYADVE